MRKLFRPTSCLDYLLRGSSKCGVYRLYDNGGNSYPAYCDLNSEPGTAWTLIMSWSTRNRKLPAFDKFPFKYNSPVNENAQNWNLYRLSLARMKSLQSHSTHWRATCSYPTHGIDFRDYVRGSFKDFNVIDYLDNNKCKKVEYINIRGHIGIHQTVPFWQIANSYLLHTDSTYATCQFKPKAGSVSGEDNFGHYRYINPKFRCTQGSQSTTQWWLGELDIWAYRCTFENITEFIPDSTMNSKNVNPRFLKNLNFYPRFFKKPKSSLS